MSAALTVLSRLDADDAPRPREAASPARLAAPPSARPSTRANGVLSALGAGVVGLGLVLMPLPGPFGLPVTLLGLVLLLKHSPAARRKFVRASLRHPRVLGPVRRLLRQRHAAS
jgi:hypothetical protein